MANELDTELFSLELSAEVLAVEETSQTLADDVLDKVQDGSYSWEDAVKLFNACLYELAGEFLIPDLEQWTDLYTDPGVNHAPLPADYMRNLRYVHSVTHNRPRIRIQGSVVQLFRWYSNLDRQGPVRQVAVKGRQLYYQLVPSTAEQLRINYFSYPERLRLRDDKPTCLPAHLIEPLLVAYACRELFNEIEDALEGAKPNTAHWGTTYDKAKAQLAAFLGPEKREPEEFRDEIHWDALV
jgi:hypothetical protein